MVTRVVVVGGGGCGREVLDVIDAINHVEYRFEVVGVLDDGPLDPDTLRWWGLEQLGPVALLDSLDDDIEFVLGIGTPAIRRRLTLLAGDRKSPTLVHPTAVLAHRGVTLGAGTVICATTCIQSLVRVGQHVHVNQGCTLGHDVVIKDHVVVSPLVALSGNVLLAEGSFVGAGAVINPGVRVGVDARVGSGAAVIRDVLPGATVVGVPARPI